MSIMVALLALALLIFFHELGHFYAAKSLGVVVERFSIGFGPKILTTQKGDTEYVIALLPLGGYVKMRGQNDFDPTKRDYRTGSYDGLSPLGRIFILVAGPLANFVVAFVIYVILAFTNHQVLVPKVGTILPDSPAMGILQPKDEILQINQKAIDTWGDISKVITQSHGTLEIYIKRNGQEQLVWLTPTIMTTTNIFKETIERKMIGIGALGETRSLDLGILEAMAVGLEATKNASVLIFTGLTKLIQGVIAPKEVGSVIGIVDVTAKATAHGWVALLGFVALISVNLGVLNLLPIPALDGGHIMFNLYEMIFKKPPREKVFAVMTVMGWGILLSVMLLGIYNDLNRLLP